MRLFDLIEQDHLIGSAPHGFGQGTAFVIANIARWRTDQARDGMLFHIFRHVDADHGLVIIEQEIRQCFGKFRLPDTGWAQKQETANGSIGVLKTRTGTAHRAGYCGDCLTLANHAFAQQGFHLQKLFAFTLQHLVDRNTGPA